jgi:hypothetical protein
MTFALRVASVVLLEVIREWLNGLFEIADDLRAELLMVLVRMEARP